MPSKLTRTTTDHDEIRRWAEERGAEPAEVERTEREGETGMIRLDFPGYSGEGSLKHISWDEWFDKFDSSGLALVYQERTAQGQTSNFNKLIARETAEARERGEDKASRRSLRSRGESRRGGARSARGGARARRSSTRASSRTGRAGARGRGEGRAGRTRGGSRTSSRRQGKGTREAPRAVAARLTGRAHTTAEEGGRTPSRRRSSGRGRATARRGGKATRRTTSRTPSRRRSTGRGRRRS